MRSDAQARAAGGNPIASDPTRIAVDVGGTFTDVVAEWSGGRATVKRLSTPEAPERGMQDGIDRILAETGIDPAAVDLIVHGTTLATNAIIERTGAPTALVTTAGFRDVIETGYESRYDQYDVYLDKPAPLVPRRLRLTVPERITANGHVLEPLDENALRSLVPILRTRAIESVAIGFLHSYVNPVHERRAREILVAALPGLHVSLSCEVCPEIREYERLSTTCANAYVQPLVAGYLTRVRASLDARGLACPLLMMGSGGGLMTLDAAIRFPVRLLESGPAGGAILAGHVAARHDLERALSFDMGGTTAKVCLIERHEPQSARAFEVDRADRFLKGSGLPLRIPVIEMIEIGAGGGSIAHVDGLGQIAVGPRSAGADPGPACYSRGGTKATVTDADLTLGRVDADGFAGGDLALDSAAAHAAIGRDVATPLALSAVEGAWGICEVVDERMANAARVHAIERGKTVGDHALVAFGGAAPLHAARLAEKLGIERVVIPASAGVGSAVGLLRAPIGYEVAVSHYMRLGEFDAAAAARVLRAAAEEARAVVRAGAPDGPLVERRSAFMRYVGQGHEIAVALPESDPRPGDAARYQRSFDAEYRRLFARTIPGADVEILSWVVRVATVVAPPAPLGPPPPAAEAVPAGTRRVYDPGREVPVEVAVFSRDGLAPGSRVTGPAIIEEAQTTTFVAAAFAATVSATGDIVLDRRRS